MTPEQRARVKALFHEAIERPAEQPAVIQKAEREDREVAAELRRLLALHVPDDSFLVEPPAASASTVLEQLADGGAALPAGTRIHGYEILDVLGRGGMGIVYRARQQRPQRIVALKMLRTHLATPRQRRRFEYEAELLARLRHPGIAHIIEAGIADTAHGPQPFFAMEWINGVSLLDFATRRRLGVRGGLALLADVADAVAHAHEKGVIHRDLKPSNILVDDAGQPKVLDFGVARATDADLQTTALTGVGQLVGTLAYMSPEQVDGDAAALDTRSDVYALGVIAHELLTGRLPYRLDGKTLAAAARVIQQEQAPPLHRTDSGVPWEAAAIVGKALEKESAHRYANAGELAADIRRFLDNQPISARPTTALYQLRKFARRNRGLVAAVVTVVLALSVGAVGAGLGWRQARHAEIRARNEAGKARAINDFLQDMLTSVDPDDRGSDVRVVDVLHDAAALVETAFAEAPEVAAEVHTTLASAFFALGLYADAEPHLRAALTRMDGDADLADERDEVINDLALVLHAKGEYAAAVDLCREALPRLRVGGMPRRKALARVTNTLGLILFDQGDHTAAEALRRESLALRRSLHPEPHVDVATSLNNLAQVEMHQEAFDAARDHLTEALSILNAAGSEASTDAARVQDNLGALHLRRGDAAAAETELRAALAARRTLLGELHPDVANTLNNLALALRKQGRWAEARPLYHEALDIYRQMYGPDDLRIATPINNLAGLYYAEHDFARAEELFREALAIRRRYVDADHPEILTALNNLAGSLFAQHDYAAAEPIMREVLASRRRIQGNDSLQTAGALFNLGTMLHFMDRPADAEVCAREAYEIRSRHPHGESSQHANVTQRLAHILLDLERYAEAERLYREVLALRIEHLTEDDWRICASRMHLGICLLRMERYADAEPLLESAAHDLERQRGDSEPTRTAYAALADLCEATGRPDEAAHYRTAFAAQAE